jgi:isopentenyldiphosphate isomerase
VGITIACIDGTSRILTAHRRHKVFDRVWTLSGDTHPHRIFGGTKVESLGQAAKRCAADDLGVTITGWTDRLVLSYSARDPRDSRYCENELLHVMVSRYDGPFHMNPKNVYKLRWAELGEVSNESKNDLSRDPINRKYAPWVHAMFAQRGVELGKVLSGAAEWDSSRLRQG